MRTKQTASKRYKVIGSLLVAASLFAACGNSDSSADDETTTIDTATIEDTATTVVDDTATTVASRAVPLRDVSAPSATTSAVHHVIRMTYTHNCCSRFR